MRPQSRNENFAILSTLLKKRKPVVVTGPSGVGKTAITLDCASELGLRAVLFEACRDRHIADDKLVLIENFQGLDTQTQHDLLNMLRTPDDVETTPSMARLRGKPLVIMSTALINEQWGRSAGETVHAHPLPDLRHLLHSAAPVVEVEFQPREWIHWAAKENIPTAAMLTALACPHLLYENGHGDTCTPRDLAKISEFLAKDGRSVFIPGGEASAAAHLSKYVASVILEHLYRYTKSLHALDLAPLGTFPNDVDLREMFKAFDLSPLGIEETIPLVLAMAATKKTLPAFCAQIEAQVPGLLVPFIDIVKARGLVAAAQ